MAVLFLGPRHTRWGWGVSPTPRPPVPPGKTRYPLYRRLGGPQVQSGRAENFVPTGIRSRTVQPLIKSLYRLSYRPININYHFIIQFSITGRCYFAYRKVAGIWPPVMLLLRVSERRRTTECEVHFECRNKSAECSVMWHHTCFFFANHSEIKIVTKHSCGISYIFGRWCLLNRSSSWLNKDRPTWCHLLYYFTIYCSTCFEC
jgi:hypothetical protein